MPLFKLSEWEDVISNIDLARVRHISVFQNEDCYVTDLLTSDYGVITSEPVMMGYAATYNDYSRGQDTNRTISQVVVPLYCKDSSNASSQKDTAHLVYAISCSRNSTFAEDTIDLSMLHAVDGAIVVVDMTVKEPIQTDSILYQIASERIKPVFFFDKLFELMSSDMDAEAIYSVISDFVSHIEFTLSLFHDSYFDTVLPTKSSVAFGSSKQKWGFTLHTFAKLYATKFGINEEKMANMLWGEHFYDLAAKRWTNTSNNGQLPRGFCKLVLVPLLQLRSAILSGDKERYEKYMNSLNISLTKEEKTFSGNPLLNVVMHKFLPLAQTLIDMTVIHLPSPVNSQQFRLDRFYKGEMNDETACSILACNKVHPCIGLVFKTVPTVSGFVGICRVFSGSIRSGGDLFVSDSTYENTPGNSALVNTKKIQVSFLSSTNRTAENVPCGHICVVTGISKDIVHSGILTDMNVPVCFTFSKPSGFLPIQVLVEPKNPVNLPKLIDALRLLSKEIIDYSTDTDINGSLVLHAKEELQLDSAMKSLVDFCGFEISFGTPTVSLCETVTSVSEICTTLSPNKHNRLFMKALPLEHELYEAIEEYNRNPHHLNLTEKALKRLSEYTSWDQEYTSRIWHFEPTGAILVDLSTHVPNVKEIRESIATGFQWCASEGPLCARPLRGVQICLYDAYLHSDSIHRGGGQIIPTVRRCIYAAILSASPRLMEPAYTVEIRVPTLNYFQSRFQCKESSAKFVQHEIAKRRGEIVTRVGITREFCRISAVVPTESCFGFRKALQDNLQSFLFQFAGTSWQLIPGDPLDSTCIAGKRLLVERKNQGLSEVLPTVDTYTV